MFFLRHLHTVVNSDKFGKFTKNKKFHYRVQLNVSLHIIILYVGIAIELKWTLNWIIMIKTNLN